MRAFEHPSASGGAAATLPSTGGAHPLQLATGGVPTDALDNSSDAGASWFAEVTAGDAAGVPKKKQRTSVGQDAAAATAETGDGEPADGGAGHGLAPSSDEEAPLSLAAHALMMSGSAPAELTAPTLAAAEAQAA